VIPVVTAEQMRAVDAAAAVPVEVLIGRAGAAVARVALELLGGAYGRKVVVLAGPGNNGADGRAAADRLRGRGVRVEVIDVVDGMPDRISEVDLVIDAGFGTGFHGEWHPPRVGAIPVLAVDVPTGLDADTGVASEHTLHAVATVTFQAAKPGHYFGGGPGRSGAVRVCDIGLDIGDPAAWVLEDADVGAWMPTRPRDSHKWKQALRIVAGSAGMTGAAELSSHAAQRAGASLVALSSPGAEPTPPVEAIERRVRAFDWADEVLEDLHRYRALVIGPGLGREQHTLPSVVRTVTGAVVPVVIDGDGLFALAWNDAGTAAFLAERELPTVLTPHDGEYATLTGEPPADDRIAAARALVDLTGACVLLKGPSTVVAAPDEIPYLVTIGDQRLATAGTGDVLSGVVGALLAQGLDAARAAAAGAYVHAAALRRCATTGVVAGDLVEHLAATMTDLVAASGTDSRERA